MDSVSLVSKVQLGIHCGFRACKCKSMSGLRKPLRSNFVRSREGFWRIDVSRQELRRDMCVAVFDPQSKIDFPLQDDEEIPDIPASPPPTPGRLEISINNTSVKRLDLTEVQALLQPFLSSSGSPLRSPKELLELTLGFKNDYKFDDPLDPRELSELPDVRLWFVRLDAAYPWLPAVLDWRGGELARYSALLIPHQMSRRLGLVFNPEALELWAMNKLFVVYHQLKLWGVARPDIRTRDMMKVLGFSVDDELFELIDPVPPVENE